MFIQITGMNNKNESNIQLNKAIVLKYTLI